MYIFFTRSSQTKRGIDPAILHHISLIIIDIKLQNALTHNLL